MAERSPALRSFPVLPPSAAEAAALSVAAGYLARAGTRTASLLLGGRVVGGDAALLEALRDSLLGSAALCDGLLDLADQRKPAAQAAGDLPAGVVRR